MRPIFLALFLSAAASAQPLFLQAEHPVAPPRIGVPSLRQSALATATDGTNQLLVWRDSRNDLPAQRTVPVDSDLVCAARIDSRGTVLDSPSLVLPLKGKAIPFWNGHEFVVVAAEEYVRISASGELLDPVARPYAAPHGALYSIGWTGERLLVVTVDDDARVLRGGTFDGSMGAIRRDFVIDVITFAASLPPRIAANGSGFMIAGVPTRNGVIALDGLGNIIGRNDVASGFLLPPVIASDGTNYLVVGLKVFSNSTGFVAVNVAPTGAVRRTNDPAGSTNIIGWTSDLTWDGDNYRLVYTANPLVTVKSISFDRDGGALDPDGTALRTFPAFTYYPTLLAAGRAGARFVFWTGLYEAGDLPASSSDMSWWKGVAYTDPASFKESKTFDFSRGALPEETPVIATAGDVSLLVWRAADATAANRFALFAARVDRAGRVLDASPIRVADTSCSLIAPAVATDGKDFLIVWQQPLSVRAARVSHDGRLLDSAPILPSNALAFVNCMSTPPGIAWNGTNYLVVWTDGGNVYGSRITAGGAVLDNRPIAVFSGTSNTAVEPRVASNGRDFMVAWTDPQHLLIHAGRLTGSGALLEPGGVTLMPGHPSALYWSGTNYVVLSSGNHGVHAARITGSGLRLDDDFSSTTALLFPTEPNPRVECGATGCFTYALTGGDVIGTRIDDSGPVKFESTVIAHGASGWRSIVVFGDVLKNLAYLRLAPESPYADTWHLFIRSTGAGRERAVR